MEIRDIICFDEPGPSNTDRILELAIRRIEARGIRHVIIAAAQGLTVRKFLEIKQGLDLNVVAVTNPGGATMRVANLYSKYKGSKRIKEEFAMQGVDSFPISISDETREYFEKEGVKIVYLSDPLGFGGRAVHERQKAGSKMSAFLPGHVRPLDIEAGADLSLLNIISMGFRVMVGITVMTVDRGLVPEGQTVLSIAGTGFAGGGADTAAVLRAGRTAKGCLVKEILGFPELK